MRRRWACPTATAAALQAPPDTPTQSAGWIPSSTSVSIAPIWYAHRADPPDSTSPTRLAERRRRSASVSFSSMPYFTLQSGECSKRGQALNLPGSQGDSLVEGGNTMNHRLTLPALGLGFLLAVSAWGQHHSVVGNDYDDDPGGGDPNPSSGCTGVQAKITISGGGITFSPASVTVDPGQPVCWTWSGG